MSGKTTQPGELDRDLLISLYRQMVRIRQFEEHVLDLYARAMIPGIAHVSIGQEAVAVGICAALQQDDFITSTHRGHGHCLAKGARADKMFAELFGRVEGYCRGKGGSMHIADPETGNLGANAIVGGSVAIAAGAALSAKRARRGQVAVCFFGDGALNQGLLLESMNMAAVWQLPVIYVCENNQYGEYTATNLVTAGKIAQRGEALGIRSVSVNGMNVAELFSAATSAVEQARAGGGPSFLVCDTYRYYGHGTSDRNRPYRSREEEEAWRKQDPIDNLAHELATTHGATQSDLEIIDKEIRDEMQAAIEFGLAASYPQPEEVTRHVYVE